MDMVIGFGAVPSAEVRASAGRDAKPSATNESTARMGTLQRCFLLFMTCLPIFDDEIQPDSLRRNISRKQKSRITTRGSNAATRGNSAVSKSTGARTA